MEGSKRALNWLRTINHQLHDKLTLLQNLDGEILELVPVDKVENKITEADVNLSKIIDIQEQIADFMAKSRVISLKSSHQNLLCTNPAKSHVQAKTVDLCFKTADVSVPTNAESTPKGMNPKLTKLQINKFFDDVI